MIRVYPVDGVPLTGAEVYRHRGAVNAALNRLATEIRRGADAVEVRDHTDSVAYDAFEYADAVVREYRGRCIEVAGGGR